VKELVMAGALDGIRVLDLTWGVAGPLGVLQLAEHGADVIKVEPPGGDPFRAHPGYPVWNRSRRSITLDLREEEGRDALHALLDDADVLVESFRPGVMDRLGLGYDALSERFPRLVYCSVPGYPPGHRAAGRPAYDALVQARSGQQHEQPGWRDGPIFLHMPMPSMGAQFLVQLGVTGALIARERTGRGQHVTTSLYQGALLFTTMMWQHAENDSADYHAVMAKTDPPGIHQPTLYECADGEWIHAATMAGLTPTKSQEEVLGMPPGPDFAAIMGMSPEERRAYDDRVRDAFAAADRDELVEGYHDANMGAEAVLAPDEVHDHAQLRANDMVVEVDDPQHGPTTQIGIPVKLSATPGAVKGPQPRPGADTAAVLRDAGYSDEQIADLAARGIT
jgi:crotonobetainyl-CoA:carnitine CoA-transferase CaiB-like acyl-CoA transferase